MKFRLVAGCQGNVRQIYLFFFHFLAAKPIDGGAEAEFFLFPIKFNVKLSFQQIALDLPIDGFAGVDCLLR